jgi:hypothetical protein
MVCQPAERVKPQLKSPPERVRSIVPIDPQQSLGDNLQNPLYGCERSSSEINEGQESVRSIDK